MGLTHPLSFSSGQLVWLRANINLTLSFPLQRGNKITMAGWDGVGWRLSPALSLPAGFLTKAKCLSSHQQEGMQEARQTLHSVLGRDQLFLSFLIYEGRMLSALESVRGRVTVPVSFHCCDKTL